MAIFSNSNISSLKVQSYDRELNKYKIFRRLFIVSFFICTGRKEKKNMKESKVEQKKSNPDMVKEINGIVYVVRAYFKEGAGETMEEKIKRMLRNEVINMNMAG